MRSFTHRALVALAMVISITAAAYAQTAPPAVGENQKKSRAAVRRDLFRQLGLDRFQMREVGQLNTRRRPVMEAAQQRFRQATIKLDEAIYADQLDEALVQERLKEVQIAQGELIRLRSTNELALRKILTPEQLKRFRQMRQRFDATDGIRAGRRAYRKASTDMDVL